MPVQYKEVFLYRHLQKQWSKKYIDKNTGAKILYHSGNKVALILDIVVTD